MFRLNNTLALIAQLGPLTKRRWNDLKYESIFILAPDLPDTDIDETLKNVEGLITEKGGTVLESERWEKKRLAYPVKKHKYGYYILIRFEAPPNLINLLEKHYRLSEPIIKFLTIKVTDFKKQTPLVPIQADNVVDVINGSKGSSNIHNNQEIDKTNNIKKSEEEI